MSLNASPCSEGPVSECCAHLWLSHRDHSFPLIRILNFFVGLYYYGDVVFNGDFGPNWKCGYLSMALILYIVYVPRTLRRMPDKYSSVVSQAAEDNWIYHRGSAEHAKYIRHYHIMNYDYTASDDPVESCAHLCLNHLDLRLRSSL